MQSRAFPTTRSPDVVRALHRAAEQRGYPAACLTDNGAILTASSKAGNVTVRHHSRLHHIGLGRPHAGWHVVLLIAGRDIRILTLDGSQLRRVTLDPQDDDQPIS